jgi:hypothetical protein
MDTSIEENTANDISSSKSLNLAQIIIDKVKNVFGFFTMTEDEMGQAGIDHGEHSVSQPTNGSETESDPQETQNVRRVA